METIVNTSSLHPRWTDWINILDNCGSRGNSAILLPNLVSRPSSSKELRECSCSIAEIIVCLKKKDVTKTKMRWSTIYHDLPIRLCLRISHTPISKTITLFAVYKQYNLQSSGWRYLLAHKRYLFQIWKDYIPLINREWGHYRELLYGYNSTPALIGCWVGIIFL